MKTIFKRLTGIVLIAFVALAVSARDIRGTDPVFRVKLAMAADSKSITDELYNELNSQKNKNSLMTAYFAAVQALKAKHAFNPFSKLKYLRACNDNMMRAISMDAGNVEVRFLRFSVQFNTPHFLGYSKNLAEDKNVIVHAFSKSAANKPDPALASDIANFVLRSDLCTAAERKILTDYIHAPR